MKKALFTLGVLFLPALIIAAPEDLDEMFERKGRRATATYDSSQFENPSTFVWQSETLMYTDIHTGHEVWKMSDTPHQASIYHNDIGVTPWSADGKRMGIAAKKTTQAYRSNDGFSWFTVNTRGTHYRPTPESFGRYFNSVNPYFHWSPQLPDVYYDVAYVWPHDNAREIYKHVVADTAVSSELILTLPRGVKLDKMISGDGKKLLISSWPDETLVFPATVIPTPRLDAPNGYSIDRNLALYGTTPNPYSYVHDRYYAGDGSWYFIMPLGDTHRAWWKLKTLGSFIDGGALCDNSNFPVTDVHYDFGECWPVNAESGSSIDPGENPDPWNRQRGNNPIYWSHFVPDRWGRISLFSNSQNYVPPKGYGPGTYDIETQKPIVLSFGGGASHHDWHGFTDWTVSSSGSGENGKILSQKYDEDNSQMVICHTYRGSDGGSDYTILTRPGQSPDGTKVAWHSEFLNAKNKADVFWSVVYYPFPPTDLEAVSSGGGVELRWLPPKYTDRRWINPATNQIDEVNGEELFAREIKQYHVWRAPAATGPWMEVGTGVTAEYGNDPQTNTLKPRSNGNWVNASNKNRFNDNPGNGTWFYAVTCEEWSGLETDGLGEVLEVGVSGNSVTRTNLTRYAFDLGRKIDNRPKKFWTTPPAAPALSVSPGSAVGHYRLTWKETTDTKVRYYNIYYSNQGEPAVTQAYRIASVPVGTVNPGQDVTYLDWLADPVAQGFYRITTVDRYGNETQVASAGPDQIITWPAAAQLRGAVTDSTLTIQWSKVSGLGEVTFGNAGSLETTATFPEPTAGQSDTYVLRLTATKEGTTLSDEVTIVVRPRPAENTVGISRNVIHPDVGSEAEIRIELAEVCQVVMKIYGRDGLIRNLVDQEYPAGSHTVVWDGKNDKGALVASGIYKVDVKLCGKKTNLKIAVVR